MPRRLCPPWGLGGRPNVASQGLGVRASITKILRGIVAVGFAAIVPAAIAQLGPQLPGSSALPQTAPVQTPTITNVPQVGGQQKPAAIPQQQPAVTDQRLSQR